MMNKIMVTIIREETLPLLKSKEVVTEVHLEFQVDVIDGYTFAHIRRRRNRRGSSTK